MILLAFGVAILNLHTRLARLETSATISAALGTAGVDLVHPTGNDQQWCRCAAATTLDLLFLNHFFFIHITSRNFNSLRISPLFRHPNHGSKCVNSWDPLIHQDDSNVGLSL